MICLDTYFRVYLGFVGGHTTNLCTYIGYDTISHSISGWLGVFSMLFLLFVTKLLHSCLLLSCIVRIVILPRYLTPAAILVDPRQLAS